MRVRIKKALAAAAVVATAAAATVAGVAGGGPAAAAATGLRAYGIRANGKQLLTEIGAPESVSESGSASSEAALTGNTSEA